MGACELGSGGQYSGAIAIGSRATFLYNSTAAQTSRPASSAGPATWLSTAALTLTAANTYSGNTTINGGQVNATNNRALGSGTVTVNSGGEIYDDAAVTIPNAFVLAGTGVDGNAFRQGWPGSFVLLQFLPGWCGRAERVASAVRRDHHAGGMHRTVARHAFQAPRDLQDLGHALLLFQFAKTRLGFHGIVERDIQDVGHQFGEALHVGEAHVQRAAHVFDRGARGHGVEGDDLRHLFAAVFLGDVLDHFAAPVHAEIDIDIGQADALGIQEALEQQAVLQRIDIGSNTAMLLSAS